MNKNWFLVVMTLPIISCSSSDNKPTGNLSNKLETGSCDSSYPLAAAADGISGYVQLSFDIDETGRPVNIGVIKSMPEKVFDEAGKCALSKWKYDLKLVNGVPVYQSGLSVQLDYKLEADN